MPTDASTIHQSFLATAVPDAADRRWAFFVIIASIVSLGAMAPAASVHLPRLAAFIPSYESALAIIDLLTAALLLNQFANLRRLSSLVVASAYLLNTLLIVAHALSFPGVFAQVGLFGDPQTTAWLYVFWHGAFPLLIVLYALLAGTPRDRLASTIPTGRVIATAMVTVIIAAALLVMLAAGGARYLPVILVDGDYRRMVQIGASPGILVACGVAIAAMWRRRARSVLDVWLFAVLWVWACDVSLSAIVSASRYDLGWYGGRLFSLLAGSFVLIALLVELNKLYARLAAAVREAETRNAELVRSRGELARAQRLEALGQWTGGIAHDFNNVLTAVTGSLEMITRRPSDPDRVLRLATNASKAADRGTQLIRRLMTFARKQNLRPEVLDTNRVVGEFGVLIAGTGSPGITTRHELGDVGPVCVDAAEFQAAFLNLIGNAQDAMPAGGTLVVGTRRVTLAAGALADPEAKVGDYVEVFVQDDGTGMSQDVQARIFEPFFTTKSPGSGTGLGLSQVYGFARSAGGQVVVESTPGAGSTFRLQLPRSAAAAIERQQRPQVATQPPSGTLILLVEDDGDVLVATRDRVEELGYTVVTATSGDEAFALLTSGLAVDIVFSDIVMPGTLNGVQLAEAVRCIRPGLKLLLTSGYTGSALERFKLPKDSIFLPKPYSQQELAAKLVAVATG